MVAIVGGEPITALDIEQRTKLEQGGGRKNITRQEVLDLLIDDKLKVREGKRWGLEITDAEVDGSYAAMANRMHQSPDQLTQSLARSGITANVLKSRIRADLVWQQLVRGRYQLRLQVDDRDVASALAAKNISDEQVATFDYRMRPVLFLVPPGANEAVVDARRKEAEALRGRFRSCEEGVAQARAIRDVTVQAPVIRNSADIPAELRKIIDSVPLGSLTPPERTRLGIEMFAVCSKQEAKSDSPTKRQTREALAQQRFEQESKRYLQELRRGTLIEYR